MIEKAIYSLLSTYAPISTMGAKVSFGTVNQITGDKPYIVFYVNSTDPQDTKTGNGIGLINLKSGKSTLDISSVQINIFDLTAENCSDLAYHVREVLDRYSGTMGNIIVQSINFENQSSMFEFNDTYNSKGLYQISQFYNCRAVPE